MTSEADQAQSSNTASWITLGALAVCLGILEMHAPVPIALRGLVPLILATVTLTAVAYFYRAIRPCEEFSDMCLSLLQVLLFSAIGVSLSYLAARADNPLWDATLAGWDRSLGFDWMAAMRLVDKSAIVTDVLFLAYHSLIPQIILVVCVLGFERRLSALRMVMLAAMLCGSISILISAFMPAVAYGVFYNVHPSDFQHVFPGAGFVKMPDFESLRAGTIPKLDLLTMQGIITFPSYHAGLSAITCWGFCMSGKMWLRVPGAIIAILTIISTPIDGGHYLVDVIAGIAIAAVSLLIARRAIYFCPPIPAIRALPFRRSREAFAR